MANNSTQKYTVNVLFPQDTSATSSTGVVRDERFGHMYVSTVDFTRFIALFFLNKKGSRFPQYFDWAKIWPTVSIPSRIDSFVWRHHPKTRNW